MDNQPCTSGSSGQAGPDRSETDADRAQVGRTHHQLPFPPWLAPVDLEALAQRFPPLDAWEVRQLAIDLHQGSTPVEVLILRLVGAGLASAVARQLPAELRDLRDRPGRQTTPSE